MSVGPDTAGRLADRWELQDLVAAYALAVDDHDLDTLLGLFSPSVRFRRGDREFVGLDALRAFYVETFERYTLMLHIPYLQTVAWDGSDRATGRVGSMAQLWIDHEPIQAAFRYADEYVREGGRWRFASRDLSFLYVAPVDSLGDRADGDLRIRWPGTTPVRAAYPESLPTWRAYRASISSDGDPPR